MQTIIGMPKDQQVQRSRKNRNGIQIGCFRFCTCVHLGFLSSRSGMLKLFELLLASCCETLLINFGMRELSATAFHSYLTTVSACLSTTFILIVCYTLSARSYYLIRQSLFEIIFNGLACFSFGSAACYMGFMSKLPSYRNILLFTFSNTNPALTSIYYIGGLLTVVYFADTIVAYKYYRDSGD
ncbi:hypothetical protein PVAND_006845 [Polypedilum vanderplanki]|uniref:MARVEL domain-containing protein n=1 Tax=Polypedilum vanderplanki TaxID=319348 RepID=A0A9J6C585_POLVA|nr:hypothetical protein PVAND_006845 [Polypedilum vanderplanki]